MNIEFIHSLIDNAIAFANQNLAGLSLPVELIHRDMIDHSKSPPSEGILFWKPVPSKVTEKELVEFESLLKIRLPNSYKAFLKYKYFVELNFGHQVVFFPHQPTWIQDYFENIREVDLDNTVRSKVIPFASDDNGTGYFCFDARHAVNDNEYPIVTYNRTFGIENYGGRRNESFLFIDLLKELDRTLEDWKTRRRFNSRT